MKISDIGQFALIDAVAKLIAENHDQNTDSWKNLLDGIGDDCAVWRSEGVNQLAKVDCQVEGIHFTRKILSWEDLGWKALAVNLSDIAAMGGIPRYALVSLGLPLDVDVENVLDLYRGMLKLAAATGTAIAGGNMSRSPVVFVDVNVLGITGNAEGKYLSRAAAVPGDLVAVTGWLGSAAAALEMLGGEKEYNAGISAFLREAFARPQPRLAEGRILVATGIKAGIDISDGLLSDLGHICQASGVGATVYIEKLPIRKEVTDSFGQRAEVMALSGGEDYQLLFTGKEETIENVRRKTDYPVTVIGGITAQNRGRVIVLDDAGEQVPTGKTGWDHFKPG